MSTPKLLVTRLTNITTTDTRTRSLRSELKSAVNHTGRTRHFVDTATRPNVDQTSREIPEPGRSWLSSSSWSVARLRSHARVRYPTPVTAQETPFLGLKRNTLKGRGEKCSARQSPSPPNDAELRYLQRCGAAPLSRQREGPGLRGSRLRPAGRLSVKDAQDPRGRRLGHLSSSPRTHAPLRRREPQPSLTAGAASPSPAALRSIAAPLRPPPADRAAPPAAGGHTWGGGHFAAAAGQVLPCPALRRGRFPRRDGGTPVTARLGTGRPRASRRRGAVPAGRCPCGRHRCCYRSASAAGKGAPGGPGLKLPPASLNLTRSRGCRSSQVRLPLRNPALGSAPRRAAR